MPKTLLGAAPPEGKKDTDHPPYSLFTKKK